MMSFGKKTKKFFSIASKPGNFGATVYNRLFSMYGIDAIYLPLAASSERDFNDKIDALQLIGAHGISVSMPFKTIADRICKKPGPHANVNTLLKSPDPLNPQWLGFNTDGYGFEIACKHILEHGVMPEIKGKGALAKTIANVLRMYPSGYDNFLINATPIGMPGIPDKDNVFCAENFSNVRYFFDCVVSEKETEAVKEARSLGITTVTGVEMCMAQIAVQFEIYTGIAPEFEHIKTILKESGYEI